MRPHEELQYEHAQLRLQLSQLERAAGAAALDRLQIAALSGALCQALRAHQAKEELWVALAVDGRIWPRNERLQHVQEAHENQRTQLAILHQLLSRPMPAPSATVAAQALGLIRALRTHMTEVEIELFPRIEEAALQAEAPEATGAEAMLGSA